MQKVGIQDCTYSPGPFRLVYTDAPYDLSSYDAYNVFRLLADLVAGLDIRNIADKWMTLYLGRKYSYANPRDYCLDTLLKRIDEGLIQEHRKIFRQYSMLMDTLKNDPNTDRMLQVAEIQAADMIQQAREQSAILMNRVKALAQESTRLRGEGEKAARKMYEEAEKAELMRTQQAQEALDQTQEAMGALKARYAQSQVREVFCTLFSLYELIDGKKRSLQELPEEYSGIGEDMDASLEAIREGLAGFEIQTIISVPQRAYDGKRHEVWGGAAFDPQTARVRCSVRPGFLDRATGDILQKEVGSSYAIKPDAWFRKIRKLIHGNGLNVPVM